MILDRALTQALESLDGRKPKEVLTTYVYDLHSGPFQDRATSLESLKQSLSDPNVVSQLDPEAWKIILEKFCSMLVQEKDAFLTKTEGGKAVSDAIRLKAAAALSRLGQEFRWVCELGQAKLEAAWLKPVLQHILGFLPHRSGLFEPFAVPYTRILAQLLSHRAYRERLPQTGWEAVMALCTRAVMGVEGGGEEEAVAMDVDSDTPAIPKRLARKTTPASPEIVQLARVFSLLIIGSPRDLAPMAPSILDQLSTFFRRYSGETPCHAPLLAATNHILYESSHNCVETVFAFLMATVPYLLPLWEGRTLTLRAQLLYILRFYIRSYAPESPAWNDAAEISWERCVAQLFDFIQRDVGSRFGVGVISNVECFISSVAPVPKEDDASSAPTLLPLYNVYLSRFEDSLDKDYLPWIFSELGADVCFHVLQIDDRRGNCEKDDVVDDSLRSQLDARKRPASRAVDAPRKRPKRGDVLADIRRTLLSGSSIRDEKQGQLQILAFLIERHAHALAPHRRRTLVGILVELLAVQDEELQRWVFVCFAALERSRDPSGESDDEDRALSDLLWGTALRRSALNGSGKDAAFHLLSSIAARRLHSGRSLAAAAPEVWKLAKAEVSQATRGAIGFIGRYIGVCDRLPSSDAPEIPCQALADWVSPCLGGRAFAARLKEDSLPDPKAIGACLAVIAGADPIVASAVAEWRQAAPRLSSHPTDLRCKEESISEWRFQQATALYQTLLNGDLAKISMGTGPRSAPAPLPPGAAFASRNRVSDVIAVLVAQMQAAVDAGELSSAASPSCTSASRSAGVPSDQAPLTFAAQTHTLVSTCFALRLIADSDPSSRRSIDRSPLPTLLTTLLKRVEAGLARARGESRGFICALEALVSLLAHLVERSGGEVIRLDPRVEPESENPPAPFPFADAPLWPLPASECTLLLSSLLPFTDASLNGTDAPSHLPSATPDTPHRPRGSDVPRKSTTSEFDDGFSAPGAAAGRAKSSIPLSSAASLQLDYFGSDPATGSGFSSVAERRRLLAIRAVRLLYALLWGESRSLAPDENRAEIEDFFISAVALEDEDFLPVSMEVAEWMVDASMLLLPDQYATLFQHTTDLLHSNDKNQWIVLFVVRTLSALLDGLLLPQNQGDRSIDDLVANFLRYFVKRLRIARVPWRVCFEFGHFLVRYLKAEPSQVCFAVERGGMLDIGAGLILYSGLPYIFLSATQAYFQTILPDGDDPPFSIALALLTHREMSVRLLMGRSLPSMFRIFLPLRTNSASVGASARLPGRSRL
ncbi:hypothetical protein BDK51DRAFT_44674 [Blyttiomyces helicus]|uniref:Telomere-length maintenance and DNA damage repair domain-containing protein n=1 Tax=Blyttiomyces helicus TaxID=388810 RepID=A0A4P9W6U4_9FUNG|nr:hypothetical protein BDK51DRAFT_44674 [Blyttiomyces helicus]|eukprot:RKO87742.1 hypothetical protein BDK51DRAFT_44674 [Blyttiomyces helicus]